MSTEQRLYGLPGAEHFYFDEANCYESEIEPWLDEHDRRPRIIEEWSVQDATNHLPSAEDLIEWMTEWLGENGEVDEDCFDAFANAGKRADIIAKAEALRTMWASKVGYRMADKHLSSVTVTWDADGDPLLDGFPMYVPAPDVRLGALRLLGLSA